MNVSKLYVGEYFELKPEERASWRNFEHERQERKGDLISDNAMRLTFSVRHRSSSAPCLSQLFSGMRLSFREVMINIFPIPYNPCCSQSSCWYSCRWKAACPTSHDTLQWLSAVSWYCDPKLKRCRQDGRGSSLWDTWDEGYWLTCICAGKDSCEVLNNEVLETEQTMLVWNTPNCTYWGALGSEEMKGRRFMHYRRRSFRQGVRWW